MLENPCTTYEFLTVEEFSKKTGFTPYVIRKWVKTGEIPHTKAGAKVLINYTLWNDSERRKWIRQGDGILVEK
ncbi:MAG: helix-turn-helix domain-containing protein [Lachnospiraceae bacterium]|nr:helix-turn-helix domain-containing protein [Lachnospiraceae bacterium]